MNYNRIYASIVLRAQAEYTKRRKERKFGKYFELHHIIPKSLGGTDRMANCALLTAREHFICHWLLVKIYPAGTIGHNKMLMAFWRMRSSNEGHTRYIFSRAYEKLRIEFANYIGTVTSVAQKGTRNSHYGTKWYTNYETGEIKIFRGVVPGKPWVIGRYVFNGKTYSIKYLFSNSLTEPPQYAQHPRQKTAECKIERNKNSIVHARQLWDEFHSGTYDTLDEYARKKNVTKIAMRRWFDKYIPLYKKLPHRPTFKSNYSVIGVYD